MQGLEKTWAVVAFALLSLTWVGCSSPDGHAAHVEHPAEVVAIDGSEFSRVTLTERAVERIALETAAVREESLNGAASRVVPYSSLIYGPKGQTWIYTSPQARTFVRLEIDVDRIEGDRVYLRGGPPVGTVVASVGVAELYGTEFGVGH